MKINSKACILDRKKVIPKRRANMQEEIVNKTVNV